LFSFAPDYGGTLLTAHFPRSYIDVNRAADDIDSDLLHGGYWPEHQFGPIDPTSRSDAGIGLIRRLVKPGVPVYDRYLSAEEIQARIQTCYNPYHTALEGLIEQAHYNFGEVWHINCHSMPHSSARPRMPRGIQGMQARHSDFVIGDRDASTANQDFTHTLRDYLKKLGYHVSINDPFKGVELVRRYSNPARGRHSIQIEINKSLYMDEETGEKNRNYTALKSDIEKLVAFIAGYASEHLVPKAAD
ncbi:MAG: N-formylglutamate amidohydrolase, partial [Alphaproteobacteria bacterium]